MVVTPPLQLVTHEVFHVTGDNVLVVFTTVAKFLIRLINTNVRSL